jgi:hypothetical protein
VLYNNAGTTAGDSALTWNNTSNILSVQNITLPSSGTGVERQIKWTFTGRDVYFFGRDSDDVVGLFDSGTSSSRFYTNTSGDLVASGNVTAYSDVRLKTDLKVIPDALEKVLQLSGYTYTRTDTGERQTGLVAQEVEKILPEAIIQGEKLSLAYGNLAGLFVEAIKELTSKVKSFEAEIKDLNAKIELLENKNNK